MITRRNLAEQLRDYQLQSKRDWSSLSFWSSVNRADAPASYRWCNFMMALVLFSVAGFLYFRDSFILSFSLLGVGVALMVCWQIIGRRILAKRRQRRILP